MSVAALAKFVFSQLTHLALPRLKNKQVGVALFNPRLFAAIWRIALEQLSMHKTPPLNGNQPALMFIPEIIECHLNAQKQPKFD